MAGAAKHKLPKICLLQYALEGVRGQRGINFERMSEEELDLNEKDMAEIQRRIKIINSTTTRKEKSK